MQEIISNHDYDKLSIETKSKLIDFKEIKVINSLKKELTEYVLKQSILDNLDDFLTQLGFGFTYVGNEYKLKRYI